MRVKPLDPTFPHVKWSPDHPDRLADRVLPLTQGQVETFLELVNRFHHLLTGIGYPFPECHESDDAIRKIS
jgi:hypothetical protein